MTEPEVSSCAPAPQSGAPATLRRGTRHNLNAATFLENNGLRGVSRATGVLTRCCPAQVRVKDALLACTSGSGGAQAAWRPVASGPSDR